ncbi:alcohol dehydrogenase [Diaporthe amygdali]|uniref:alcohol dehydrogenase n=1 Tax=Phomopsis amygdali TaxID=1214568 RepID=UPI0022FEFBCA|nr:alcohol dehydrogenase [Diaporthe amygdali]KAJ0119509.1 alcohol dehydrogenase [Diaporthe amygdali]
MPPKRMFITGATGYLGQVLTEFAIAQGYTVRGLSRKEANDTKLTRLGATPVRGDLETLDVLEAESAQADIVIHLADALLGLGFDTPYDKVLAIDAAAVDAMVAGLQSSSDEAKTLITTSGTLMARPDPNGEETSEDAPNNLDSPITRYKAWDHAKAVAEKAGVRVMCVRLAPFVYGRGGSGITMFMQGAATSKVAIYVDGGSTRTTTVHVDDAARLYLLVAEKGRSGEAYNASGETNVTMKELQEAIAETVGVPALNLSKEDALAKMPPFFVNFLVSENRGSNKKAVSELGWQPTEPGIIDEIRKGSYVEVAKTLPKGE